MRVRSLTIKNLGIIEDATIPFDKPLLLFYGEVRAGKTTILNAVKLALGGKWPDDIIRHGEEEASVTLELDNGSVARSFYRGKDGTTKARAVRYVRDGKPASKPDAEIKKLLNPFLLDNEHLLRMSETERRKFFLDLFPVDTGEIDSQIADATERAKELRATIKGYGEIELDEVEPVDIAAIEAERDAIWRAHEEKAAAVRQQVREINAAYIAERDQAHEENALAEARDEERATATEAIASCYAQIEKLKAEIERNEGWLVEHPAIERVPYPDEPDTSALESGLHVSPDISEIDARIGQAHEQNARAKQYLRDLARYNVRERLREELKDLDAMLRHLPRKKAEKLDEAAKQIGIADLGFDATGAIIYEGTSAGMLSTSQIMRLSSALSDLYPDGFDLELIDRAESLGRSIFEFVDRAKEEEKTILASIVGERPAEIPEEIGVYVVDDGRVSRSSDE